MRTKLFSILSMILILILICLAACNRLPREEEPRGFYLSDTLWAMTQLSPVEWQPRQDEFRFFGKVTAAQGKTVPIYTMTGGKVGRLQVQQGDYVRKGQILAEIHSAQVAELERRRLEVRNAHREAQANWDRVKEMHEHHLASARDLLAAKHELENAEAGLRQLEEVFGVYNQARNGYYQVISPINGYVLDMEIAEGMPLPDDHREPLFVVAELDPVWVLAQVAEADLAQVEEGLEARVWTVSRPDREFRGKIDRIYQVIDASTRSATIRIPLENQDLLLKPNMSVRVQVRKSGTDSMATVPTRSLFFDSNRYWVVVYHSREDMEIREVKPVSEFGSQVQVLGNLSQKDTVLTGHPLMIYDALISQGANKMLAQKESL